MTDAGSPIVGSRVERLRDRPFFNPSQEASPRNAAAWSGYRRTQAISYEVLPMTTEY